MVNYCLNCGLTLQDRELKERFQAGQKEKTQALVQMTLEMLHSPESVFGTAEDFSKMLKELEAVLTPIMMEVYEAADAGGVREAAMPEAPSHEAVDSGGVPEAATLYYSEGGVRGWDASDNASVWD